MKKIIMTIMLIGALSAVTACSNKADAEPTASEIEENISSAQTVTNAANDERVHFQELPEEANAAFNTVINTAKDVCPVKKGVNRQYGYKGTKTVEGIECYLFSVYDFDDDEKSVKVGDFAKAVNDNIIYQLSDTGAQKLEIAKDKYALTLSKKSTTAENMLHESTAQAAERIVTR